jgi:hypothetical protein
MARPNRKFGTDTMVVGARLTPDEHEMIKVLRVGFGKKSKSDVIRACLEVVYYLRKEDEAVDGLFHQIMKGE